MKSKNEIFNLIKTNLVEIIDYENPDEIAIDNSLKSYGANSIDRMEIVTKTMEDLHLKIPMIKFGQAKNINDLVEIYYSEINLNN